MVSKGSLGSRLGATQIKRCLTRNNLLGEVFQLILCSAQACPSQGLARTHAKTKPKALWKGRRTARDNIVPDIHTVLLWRLFFLFFLNFLINSSMSVEQSIAHCSLHHFISMASDISSPDRWYLSVFFRKPEFCQFKLIKKRNSADDWLLQHVKLSVYWYADLPLGFWKSHLPILTRTPSLAELNFLPCILKHSARVEFWE